MKLIAWISAVIAGLTLVGSPVLAMPVELAASRLDTQRSVALSTGKILFTSSRGDRSMIYAMEASGSTPVMLTAGAHPAWSPDGTRVAFAAPADGHDEIDVMNADGSAPTRLTHTKTGASSPAWKPDGKQIAYVTFDNNHPEIDVMNADGSAPTRLIDYAADPAWSPDGKSIAYVFAGEIYKADADGSHPVKLTTIHAWVGTIDSYDPAWSPDGKSIAFTLYIKAHDTLYVMAADGSNVVRLTPEGDINQRSPTWSPDGTQIAFSYYGSGNDDIFVMAVDGSNSANPTRLTRGYSASQPAWSP